MPPELNPPFFDTSQWIKGSWYRFLQPGLEKATRITRVNKLAREADRPGISADDFAKEVLSRVGVEWTLDTTGLPERTSADGSFSETTPPALRSLSS